MIDSKRNYGYVDLDYVMLALSHETNQHYSKDDISNRIKKLGYGSILRESLPQGYSESKFLKELEQACKYFEDEVKNIRKAAKDKRYDLIASYFARTANFANMLSNNTEDIVSQQNKGILSEAVETKKDFLKYVDNYKSVVNKAFDDDKKNIQLNKPINMDDLESLITAYHFSMSRYNNAVKNKTLISED